jgi:DNA-binding NarL/FixJ family response regulator
VLVLSQYVEERYATELLSDESGAVGYLLKQRVADVRDFLDALERVAGGGTALDPEVVAQLLARARRHPQDELTPREREVLGLMAEGLSNAGIAGRLVVTEGAVEKHVTSIFTKLGLEARRDRSSPRPRGAAVPRRSLTGEDRKADAKHAEGRAGASASCWGSSSWSARSRSWS